MTISAMKQALEALEEVQRYDKTSEWFEKKVSALRQAIAEAEKQAYQVPLVEQLESVPADARMMYEHHKFHHENIPVGRLCHEAAEALRQAIAEAEKQEPVAIGEEWKPCVKLPIIVHVREQRKGETHVSTREGITPVKEDDLIMRGVAGEEYPIGRELFNRTYTFDTAPVHASNISQEPVDETAKDRHEFVASDYDKSIHSNPDAQAWARFFIDTMAEQSWRIEDIDEGLMTGWFANAMMAMHDHVKREWVGLTDEERGMVVNANFGIGVWEMARAIEAKLKEKNT